MIVLQGRDVGNCSVDSSVMADKSGVSARGNYCVVGGPNKNNCRDKTSTSMVSMDYLHKN